MRIKLQEISNFVCLPLPPSLTSAKGFRAGDEVEVIHDAERGQIVIRPAGLVGAAFAANPDFAPAVDEFLGRYAQAMTELAAL
jgi:hypothetical protein